MKGIDMTRESIPHTSMASMEAESKKVARVFERNCVSKSQIKISGDERHLYTTESSSIVVQHVYLYLEIMPIYWNYTKRQKLKEKRANLSRYPSYSRPEKQRKISYPEKSFKINAQSIHDKHFSKRSKSEEKDDQENVDENKVAELITRPKETWILDQQSDDFQLYLEDDLEENEEEEIKVIPNKHKSNSGGAAKSNSSRFKRGVFTCPECNQDFTFQHNLKRHMKNKHEGLKFKCQDCPKAYTTDRCLKIHIGHAHRNSGMQDHLDESSENVNL